jgi:hypothetical protein
MNTPNPALAGETDAHRGDLRPSKTVPRPITYPPEHHIGPIKRPR